MAKRVLYLQYTNPAGYPPLEHSARILADAGWQVRFLGTGAYGGANALRFPPHPRITVRQWRFCPPGGRQKLQYFAFGLWALGTVLGWRPRWVYASDLLACPFGLVLSFLPGVKVLYHEHDSPSEESRKQNAEGENLSAFRLSAFQRFLLWTRRRLARRAAVCVLPNEMMVAAYRQTTERRKPIARVWNCPARGEAEQSTHAQAQTSLRLWYHGSINTQRMPPTVLHAMANLTFRTQLAFAGYETIGRTHYVAEFLAEAERLGVRSHIAYLGPLPRSRLLLECQHSNIGISFVTMGGKGLSQVCLPGGSNKPFDYLACGLALLVSDRPDWRRMFVEPGYGLACNPEDPESIAAALRWFAEHPEETRAMGERGRQRILNEWNYETQFAPVLAAMERGQPRD